MNGSRRFSKYSPPPPKKGVIQLIGVLPSEIAHLIAREPEEKASEHQYVKTMLMKRFKLNSEKFRKNFVKIQKSLDCTWYYFYYDMKNYLLGWLNGLKIEKNYQLKDLMIFDQIKKEHRLNLRKDFWIIV